ncbi:MAG: GTP cyclohydrolase I FolE2 [Actinobacteria bacterium]|nr:GTP cyclohydrolase I FolE2 [Actinomycetota bacterium]
MSGPADTTSPTSADAPFDRAAPRRDVQSERPRVTATLSRVGVTNVEKIVRVDAAGEENLFHAKLNCFVDLAAAQKGVHMSRFEEVVNEAIDEVILGEAFRAEVLAGHIAELVRERQGGARAEVSIEARYPEHKPAPVSGVRTQEIYTMFGTAVASAAGTRRLVGVQAHGMTACPCAQDLVAERSHARLTERGFDEQQIEQIFDSVPVATHNQRGLASLHVGCPEAFEGTIEAATLLKIAEDSMSSEIYELMKRSDEVEVVEKAHRRPRFVEDCVREMISGVVDRFGNSLGPDAFVFARQENLETIHQHNVVAERYGLISEIAAELRNEPPGSARHLTLREWLDPR